MKIQQLSFALLIIGNFNGSFAMNTDQPTKTSFSTKEQKLPEIMSPAIDMKSWKTTRCVQGRLATKEDISHGSAAFVVDSKNGIAKPIAMSLPACAILKEDDNEIPVILIQAEEIVNGPKIFGAVDVFSGTHTVFSGEDRFEILQKPNELFFSKPTSTLPGKSTRK